MTRTSRSLAYLMKGFGALLFAIILVKIDRVQLLSSVLGASLLHLVLAWGLVITIYLTKSYRWHLLTHAVGARGTFSDAFSLYSSSLFLGIITPGKVGEIWKIPALKIRGIPTKDGVMLTILDRLLDIFVLSICTTLALKVLFGWEKSLLLACGVLGFVLIVIVGKHYFNSGFRTYVLSHPLPWTSALTLTGINWAIYFLQLFVLAKGFGITLNPIEFVSIMTLVGICTALPIAPAGLGTREAALLYFLIPRGFTPELIVAFSVTILLLNLLASLIGAYYFMRFPLR